MGTTHLPMEGSHLQGPEEALAEQAGGLTVFSDLESAIGGAVADDGSITDAASPDLAKIRRGRRAADARLREHLARSDDARALLSKVFNHEVDLFPEAAAQTLTVRIHHLTQAAHDQAIRQLCATLNETRTVFPGTNLTLIYEIGSSGIPPDQEV